MNRNGQLLTFKYLLGNNIAGKETNISVYQASEHVCRRKKKLFKKKKTISALYVQDLRFPFLGKSNTYSCSPMGTTVPRKFPKKLIPLEKSFIS